MRLTVSPLNQPARDALTDIAKLPVPVPAEAIADWLAQADEVWQATFNDKVIALACLQHKESQYTLTFFAVREATRRRGVGRYLYEQIVKQHAEAPLHDGIHKGLHGEAQAQWQAFCDAMAAALRLR